MLHLTPLINRPSETLPNGLLSLPSEILPPRYPTNFFFFYPADFLRPRSISIITSRRPYILLFMFVYIEAQI